MLRVVQADEGRKDFLWVLTVLRVLLYKSHFIESIVVSLLHIKGVVIFDFAMLQEKVEPFYLIWFNGVKKPIFQVSLDIFSFTFLILYIKVGVYKVDFKFILIHKLLNFSLILTFLILCRFVTCIKVYLRVPKVFLIEVPCQSFIEIGTEMVFMFMLIIRIVSNGFRLQFFPVLSSISTRYHLAIYFGFRLHSPVRMPAPLDMLNSKIANLWLKWLNKSKRHVEVEFLWNEV